MPRATADFVKLIENLRRGQFLEIVNEELQKLTKAIYAIDKPGKLMVEINFAPNGEGQVKVTPVVKVKSPIRDANTSIFYANVDGGLDRDDPRQAQMFNEKEKD